jgi:N-acetylglutamate synthase-like GNAT family acetyltransferase
MLRKCVDSDIPAIYKVINDAAIAYKGTIPTDRWHEPYMPLRELKKEIKNGVRFWACIDGELSGVMGIQPVKDVTLIRHAYVNTAMQNKGIGTVLLHHLTKKTVTGILVGTWAAATWAIRFYQKNGFTLVNENDKNLLLKTYWDIPDRQIETSVVLADRTWARKYRISPSLIAPCGMNCSICSSYLSFQNNLPFTQCKGCRPRNKQCAFIKKKCKDNLKLLSGVISFCFECGCFPCERLVHLDKRYRTDFGMSMIGNLERIQHKGLMQFIKGQYKKYHCPRCGDLISVHNKMCFTCCKITKSVIKQKGQQA